MEDKKNPNIVTTTIACPLCKSKNISDESTYQSNGILGSGCSVWKINDLRSCNECGIIFKPLINT